MSDASVDNSRRNWLITSCAVGGAGAGLPTGAQAAVSGVPSIDYSKLDAPAVWRDPRSQAAARVDALQESGMDRLDIPAFLRKQAD